MKKPTEQARADLREWLREKLQEPDPGIFDALWETLCEQGGDSSPVDDALNDPEHWRGALVDDARRLRRCVRRVGSGFTPGFGGDRLKSVSPAPAAGVAVKETSRAAAFSEYLLWAAENDPQVQAFRESQSPPPVEQLSRDLAARYHWTNEEAAAFLINGHEPFVSPVNVGVRQSFSSSHVHTRITLEVEPWVSAKTVEAIYRQEQKPFLRGENRPIHERSLMVFRFVVRLMRTGRWAGWESAYDAWQREHPSESYGNFRILLQTFNRVRDLLAWSMRATLNAKVQFDPVRRQNFHVEEDGERQYHGIPDGFEFDGRGQLRAIDGENTK